MNKCQVNIYLTGFRHDMSSYEEMISDVREHVAFAVQATVFLSPSNFIAYVMCQYPILYAIHGRQKRQPTNHGRAT